MSQIELQFRFCNFRPVSTNDAYVPTARKRKLVNGKVHYGGAFLRKSELLIKWQRGIQSAFDQEFFYSKEDLDKLAKWVNTFKVGLILELKISIPEDEYWNHSDHTLYINDTSNFIKTIEDSIYRGIGIDDTRNIKVIAEKGYNEDGVWYIEARITDTSINNRIDVDVDDAFFNLEE